MAVHVTKVHLLVDAALNQLDEFVQQLVTPSSSTRTLLQVIFNIIVSLRIKVAMLVEESVPIQAILAYNSGES